MQQQVSRASMVSLEVVQIVLVAVPFVFKTFKDVRRFLQESKGLEAKISMALRRFDKEAGTFQARWNKILGIDSKPSELDWKAPSALDLVAIIEAMDPYNREKFRDMHQDSREIVAKVIEILPKLRDVFQPDEGSTLNCQGARKQRVKHLRKEVLGPITELAIAMCECNEDFGSALDSRKRKNSSSVKGERLSHRIVKKARLDTLAMQVISNKVCEIDLQWPIDCECHLVLGRLDTESILTLSNNDTKLLKPATKVAAKIFFQFMDKSNTSLNSPVLRIYFTDSKFDGTISEHRCNTPICRELANSDDDYERFFVDKNGNGNCGLLLRHMEIEEQQIIAPMRISFLQLISRSSELFPGDVLRIAASLARSILRFACSPWASGWTPETIHFFQKESSPAGNGFASNLWIPHLWLISAPPQLSSRLAVPLISTNEAIYQLGRCYYSSDQVLPSWLKIACRWGAWKEC